MFMLPSERFLGTTMSVVKIWLVIYLLTNFVPPGLAVWGLFYVLVQSGLDFIFLSLGFNEVWTRRNGTQFTAAKGRP